MPQSAGRVTAGQDARLVGRCAALALAAEIARRAKDRRERGNAEGEPLDRVLHQHTALAASSTPDERQALLGELREGQAERIQDAGDRALRRTLRRHR